MLALSWPASLLSLLSLCLCLRWFAWVSAAGLPSILLVWILFFPVGCFQWFILVPWAIRWVRRTFGTDEDPGSLSIMPKA